ncbi:transmembrane protein, putative [Medicago truncatula]|uniref:Transmembrane protein, putative n=1 Tax=Medicago truncatula TaxID=3880 RepID=G7K2B4_MEDTR|nr:transmembrane protein, putative [Medicago truncatula]
MASRPNSKSNLNLVVSDLVFVRRLFVSKFQPLQDPVLVRASSVVFVCGCWCVLCCSAGLLFSAGGGSVVLVRLVVVSGGGGATVVDHPHRIASRRCPCGGVLVEASFLSAFLLRLSCSCLHLFLLVVLFCWDNIVAGCDVGGLCGVIYGVCYFPCCGGCVVGASTSPVVWLGQCLFLDEVVWRRCPCLFCWFMGYSLWLLLRKVMGRLATFLGDFQPCCLALVSAKPWCWLVWWG